MTVWYCRFCGYQRHTPAHSCAKCGSSVPLKEWKKNASR